MCLSKSSEKKLAKNVMLGLFTEMQKKKMLLNMQN